jgi:hypothetical protein
LVASPRNAPKAPNPPPQTGVHEILPWSLIRYGRRRIRRQTRGVQSPRIENAGGGGKPDMPIQPKDG